MDFLENQTDIIRQYPLDPKALKEFRDLLQESEYYDRRNNPLTNIPSKIDQNCTYEVLQILQSCRASSLLFYNNSSINTQLAPFFTRILKGSICLSEFGRIINLVANECPDVLIWREAFAFLERFNRQPPKLLATLEDEAVDISPNRLHISPTDCKLESDVKSQKLLESKVFPEIKNCTFRNVGGFLDRFFNTTHSTETEVSVLKAVLGEHDGKKWRKFPIGLSPDKKLNKRPNENQLWGWLVSIQESFQNVASNQLYTTMADKFEEQCGFMDIFFRPSFDPMHPKLSWKDVIVVGEYVATYSPVFRSQPTRRFVHAFTLIGSIMELWVFDRAGCYSSGWFDIHREPRKFARAFAGYATMGSETAGLDMLIQRQGACRFIDCRGILSESVKIGLQRPIFQTEDAIVCRGTTCYKTTDFQIAKFSWVADELTLESDRLRLAGEKGVEGVARMVAFNHVTSIAELRKGLSFREKYWFPCESEYPPFPKEDSEGLSRRPKSYLIDDSPKSERSNGSISSRSSSQESDEVSESDFENACDEMLWQNKILCCLVVSPSGRVISDFETPKEMLESLRDAIKAHQSLYSVGGILHRDISTNNIIIVDPEKEHGFKGMLIDLDMAKIMDEGSREARRRTGTTQFMAIGVLKGHKHTYRHDLESFLYVLIWFFDIAIAGKL
ncbi:serine/threonine-protein kinase Sgk2 [Ceratocystis lukuohia]|uniref:EKC/KEOPS complex subunit BUD32 n=1 Tax=Ceratocystis lukuohia TaxID=2019550 RepID=A0ABR4MST8_9PEZI